MPRTLIALVICAVLSGCGSPADPTATGAAETVTATTAAPPTVAVSAPASSASATPTTAAAIGRGDLLFSWYVDSTRKAAYTAARSGENQRPILTEVKGDIRSLGWTPDGEHITFVVRDADHPDGAIWRANADGTGAALFYDGLDDGCTSVFHPVWSPDGKRLSLVCYVDVGEQHDAVLAVLDVETMDLEKLVTYSWPDALDNPARWSHDGSQLAYAVLHWDPTNEFLDGSRLATINAQGAGTPKDLNRSHTFSSGPSWSPDDGLIFFSTYDLGNMHGNEVSNIFTIRPDGTSTEPYLTAAEAGVGRIAYPVWDPDGTRIWVTTLTGSELRIGWIDPETKAFTALPLVGGGAEPRP